MNKKMNAAVLHAPADLRYQEWDVPEVGPGEVLLRIRASGNCGSDLHRIMVEGTYHFPCIPGHEFAGEIEEVGDGVVGVEKGDRVTAAPQIPCKKCRWCLKGEYNLCEDYDYVGSRSDGAFAEFVKIPAANIVKLPENVGYEAAAMTDPAAVALHALKRAGGVGIGDTVAVLGAGPIGMFTCQWGKIMGADKVIATDVVDEKLEILKELGTDVTINAKHEDVVGCIAAETGGRGAHLIIETAGTVQTHHQSLLAAAKRGKVIHIGRAYTDVLLPDQVFTQIFRKELTVYGAVNTNFIPEDHKWGITVRFIESGRLLTKPLISHRLPLSLAPKTFRDMFDGKMVYNKIIFTP
jgi:L-iditol 2-dehydrogenase